MKAREWAQSAVQRWNTKSGILMWASCLVIIFAKPAIIPNIRKRKMIRI